MNNLKIGRDADGGGTSAISVVLKTVNRPSLLPSGEDATSVVLPLTTPFGVRGIKDKQQQQLFCCNRYFSSLKNYQQHLAEKAVTDTVHEGILTEMGMSQCSICSVWVPKDGMSLHLRKVHGVVRVNKAVKASPATTSSDISDKAISNATLKSGKSYVIKVSGQALSTGQTLMMSHSSGRSNSGETCTTNVTNASPPLKLITTSSGSIYPKIHLQHTTTGTAGKVIVRQNAPGSTVPVMSFGPRFIMKSNAAKTLGGKNGIPLSGTGIHKILPASSSLLQSNSGLSKAANGITTVKISGGNIIAGTSSGHPPKAKIPLNTKVDKHVLKRNSKTITKEFVTLGKGSGFKLQRKHENTSALTPASPSATVLPLVKLELEGKAKEAIMSTKINTEVIPNTDVNDRLSSEHELPILKTKGVNSGVKKMGVKGTGSTKNKNVLVLKLNNSEVSEVQGCNSQLVNKSKTGAKKKTETKRRRKKIKDGSPMEKVIDPPVTIDIKSDTQSELLSDDRSDVLHRDSLEELPGEKSDFLGETGCPKSVPSKKRRKQVLKPVIEPEGDPNMVTRLTSKVKVRKKGKNMSIRNELLTPNNSKKNSSSPSVNHKKYCKRLKENKCDTYKPTPKTSRQSGKGSRGGWKKKRPVGRPRREQVAEPATPDLSELDTLFDHLDNEDLENEPLVSTKTKDDEYVPTVELDMFTLPSLNEQISVLLTDPHNPDFKVYASMDAIFVGDSALGDVTNQIGYVTDANNVVFVNPGHFLFPNIDELDKFVPSPILTVKEKIHMSPKKMGKMNSGTRHSSVICKENHFVKKSPKGNIHLHESLGSDRKQTKAAIVGQKKASTVSIGPLSPMGVKLSQAKVVSELPSLAGEVQVVKEEGVTDVGIPGPLDSLKEVRVRRRSVRLSGEKSDGEQAPVMLMKDEELGFKEDVKKVKPKLKKIHVDVKAAGPAVRKAKTCVNNSECNKELKVLISPIKLEYQNLVESLKEEQKKISLKHKVALTFDNHDDNRICQDEMNLRQNGVPLEPSSASLVKSYTDSFGASVKNNVEESSTCGEESVSSPRRLRTRTRSADSANSVKPLRIESSSSGICNSNLNNHMSKRKVRLKSESDVSRAKHNVNSSGISVSTYDRVTHGCQLDIEVEKNSAKRSSGSVCEDSLCDIQHQRTGEGKLIKSSLSRSSNQSLPMSEPSKPVVKTLVENSVIQGKNSSITNNGSLSSLRSRPIRERRPSSKWLESLALERRSRKMSSPKLRTERSSSDTTDQSSLGKRGLLSDCENHNSVMLNVEQLQVETKVLSENCRSEVKNNVGIVKVNVDEMKMSVNEEIDMKINDVRNKPCEEEKSVDCMNRGGSVVDGQLTSGDTEGISSGKEHRKSEEKECEKILKNEKMLLLDDSSVGSEIDDSVQNVQSAEIQPGHLGTYIDRDHLSCKKDQTNKIDVLPPCVLKSEENKDKAEGALSCLDEKYNLHQNNTCFEEGINACKSYFLSNDGSASEDIGKKLCTGEMHGQVEKVGHAEKDTENIKGKWEERRVLNLPRRKNRRGILKDVDNVSSPSSSRVDNKAVVKGDFCETDAAGASTDKVNHSEAVTGESNGKVVGDAEPQENVLTLGEVMSDVFAPSGGDDSYGEEEERGKSQEKDIEVQVNPKEEDVINSVENKDLNMKGNAEVKNNSECLNDVSLAAEVTKGTESLEQKNLVKTSVGMNSINVSFEGSQSLEVALLCMEKSEENNQKKEPCIESEGLNSDFNVANMTDSVEKKDDEGSSSVTVKCLEAGIVSHEKSSMKLIEFERKKIPKEIDSVVGVVDEGTIENKIDSCLANVEVRNEKANEGNVGNEAASLGSDGIIGNEMAGCLANVEATNEINKASKATICLAHEENLETGRDPTSCGAYQEVKVGSDTGRASQWPEIRERSSVAGEDDIPIKKSKPVKKVLYSKKKGRIVRKKMDEIVTSKKQPLEDEGNIDVTEDGGNIIGAESEVRIGEAAHVCESEVIGVGNYEKMKGDGDDNDKQSLKVADSKIDKGDEEAEVGITVCKSEITSNTTYPENVDSKMTEFGSNSNKTENDIDLKGNLTSLLGKGMKSEGSNVETKFLQEGIMNKVPEMEEAKCGRMEDGNIDNNRGKADKIFDESKTKKISYEIKDNVSGVFETTTDIALVEHILEGETDSKNIGDQILEATESETMALNAVERNAWDMTNCKEVAKRVEGKLSKIEGEFKSSTKSRGKSSSPKSTGSPSPSKVALDWSPSREWLGRGAKLKAQVLIQDQQTGVMDSHVFSSHGSPDFKKTLETVVSPEKPDTCMKGDKEKVSLGTFSTNLKVSGIDHGATSPIASKEAQGTISPKTTGGSQEAVSPRASGGSQVSTTKVPRYPKSPRASYEDREWQARGAKLKAKIMISDQQSGQINTRVDVTDNPYLPPLKSPPLKRIKLETSPSINMKDIRSFFTIQRSPEPLAKYTASCEVTPKSSSNITNCQSTEAGNSPSPLSVGCVDEVSRVVGSNSPSNSSPSSSDCVNKVNSPVDTDSPYNPRPSSADCVSKVSSPLGADSPNPSPSSADCVSKVSSPVDTDSPCNPSSSSAECFGMISRPVDTDSPCNPRLSNTDCASEVSSPLGADSQNPCPSSADCVSKVSSPVDTDSPCNPSPSSAECYGMVRRPVDTDSPCSTSPSSADFVGKVSNPVGMGSPCNPSPSNGDCSKAFLPGMKSSNEHGLENSNCASKLKPLSTSSSSIIQSSQSMKSSVNDPSFLSNKMSHPSAVSPVNKSSPQSGRRRKLKLYSVTSSDIRTFFSPLPSTKRKRESSSSDICKTLKTEEKEEDGSSPKSPKKEDVPDVCPLQITHQYEKRRVSQNYPGSANSIVPKDFEGFFYRSRQSGLRAKALVRVVSLIQKRRWCGVGRFPLPVDHLCDWDDDMLDDRIFDKFS